MLSLPTFLLIPAISCVALQGTTQTGTCTLGHPNGYTCGSPGSLNKVDTSGIISKTSATSLAVCRDRCLVNRDCLSFWYNSKNKICTLSTAPLYKQGFVQDSKSTVTFYNRNCWTGSGCPKPPATTTTSSPTPTPTPTGLLDGDFEGNGSVWHYDYGTIGTPGYMSNNAFHWDAPTGNVANMFGQLITDTRGMYYTLSFYCRSTDASNENTVNLAFGDLTQYLQVGQSDPSVWQKFEFPVLGGGPRDNFYMFMRSSSSQIVSYALDNFVLAATNLSTSPAPGASPLNSNGNFAGGSFDGWTIGYQSPGQTTSVGQTGPNGSYAFTWTTDGTSIGDVLLITDYSTPLVQGQEYIFSCDYKADPTAQAQARIMFGGTTLTTLQPLNDGSTWATYTRRIRALQDDISQLTITIINYKAGSMSLTNFQVIAAA